MVNNSERRKRIQMNVIMADATTTAIEMRRPGFGVRDVIVNYEYHQDVVDMLKSNHE